MPTTPPRAAHLISSASVPAGGFTPGAILVDRYRIIGLLGRGGMGEVYRADDLKLGQPVALKFLPHGLASDPVRRERFFAEVRITRQLAHPNICRVYDITEVEGQHFLSMEYIDGEDLASLLKRIGYLSNEKALDIARQLAAGLAAAHERGVLHRDLKPANIMIDGHGRVRITDFGLAITDDEATTEAQTLGTPAYMAPEQFAGKAATTRSDIYALGLILYELYTGRRAFTSGTIADLRQEKEGTPRAPSELRKEVDPVIDRLIMRCLDRDPRSRPASVSQLALALPGGDPLAAALAAGETPSPAMVAASGLKQGFRPAVTGGILAVFVICLIAAFALNERVVRRAPMPKAPEALAERARQILSKAGYSERLANNAYGFVANLEVLQWITTSDNSATRWDDVGPATTLFWYRESQALLNADQYLSFGGRTTSGDPPLQRLGDALVILDSDGRLWSLRIIPPRAERPNTLPVQPDWSELLSEAGMSPSQWTSVAPERNPISYADARAAWSGIVLKRLGLVRIEAASYQGRPTSFEIVGPWTRVENTVQPITAGRQVSSIFAELVLLIVPIAGGAFYARRNLRLGRGDRHGATRLSFCILGACGIQFVFAHHHDGIADSFLFVQAAGFGLLLAGIVWIVYVALEPFVRRRFPEILVSWARLLAGEANDSLVARDILLGCAFAGVRLTATAGSDLLASLLHYPEPAPVVAPTVNSILTGTNQFIAFAAESFYFATFFGFALLFVFFLLQTLSKNRFLAGIVWVFVFSVLFTSTASAVVLPHTIVITVALNIITFILLLRVGFLTLLVSLYVQIWLSNMPFTLQTNAWFFNIGLAGAGLVLLLALWAFRTSMGSQPVLGRLESEA